METDLRLEKMCDMCGQPVPEAEAVNSELAVGDGMCPTPMVLHASCAEQASGMWFPDTESTCVVDPLFPETQQWPMAGPPEA